MTSYILSKEQHRDIKNREFSVFQFITNGKKYICYSKLMQYLISDSPVLLNKETKQPENVERGQILDIYATAYDKGRELFRNEIKNDASPEYLNKQYSDYYNGWKNNSEAVSLFLIQSQVEKMGLNAGIRFEFEIYREKKLKEFVSIEKKINTPPPAKLIKTLSENQQKYLFNQLTENSLFLPKETDFKSFCFVFGNSITPDNFNCLQWLKNKQLLRELITELKHPDIEITKNKFYLPDYFSDKKDKPILYLPTNKPKTDKFSTKIVVITTKMRQTN